jgi:hypothetical protein
VNEEKKMTNQIFNQTKNPLAENVFAYKHDDRDVIAETWTKYHIGTYIGLIGGFIILLGAVFLTVFEYFAGENRTAFGCFYQFIRCLQLAHTASTN